MVSKRRLPAAVLTLLLLACSDSTTAPEPGPLTVTTSVLPAATVGARWSATLQASGGAGDYLWSVDPETLPPDLEFAPTGETSGIPTVTGSWSVQVEVRSDTAVVAHTFELVIGSTGRELGIGFGPEQFVSIAAGSFRMGTDEFEPYESRPHTVVLTRGFEIQKTEVTQAQWLEVMGSNPSFFEGCDLCPVERISWNEAVAFVARMNEHYPEWRWRLPTEAEWEYAARAGATGLRSPDGTTDEVAWHRHNSGHAGSTRTRAVALKLPNAWGLYDTLGNVHEWVQDRSVAAWADEPWPEATRTDPTGAEEGSYRILRGGSYGSLDDSGYSFLTYSARLFTNDELRRGRWGLRLVRERS